MRDNADAQYVKFPKHDVTEPGCERPVPRWIQSHTWTATLKGQAVRLLFLKKEEVCIHLETIIRVCVCCLLYTSPSPRDVHKSRMPSSA